jgi:hypothetical protein
LCKRPIPIGRRLAVFEERELTEVKGAVVYSSNSPGWPFLKRGNPMDTVIPPGGEIDDRRKNPDRRGSSRRRTLKFGRTFWPNGDSSECVVFNLSDTGAQLEVQGPLPKRFDLVVDGDPSRRASAVVWRKANRVGVKFQSQYQSGSSNPDGQPRGFRYYAQECQRLADRADPSDRQILLEMAEAWNRAIRRLNRKPLT